MPHPGDLWRALKAGEDQGAVVGGAVPLAVGAGPTGVGVVALPVGPPVGEGLGEALSDGVGVPVGNEAGVGKGVSVRGRVVGVPSGVFVVVCVVVAGALGVAGLVRTTAVVVVATVGAGGTME